MSDLPTYEEGVTVATKPLPYPSIVWVVVEGVHKPRTKWTYRTYTFSEDEPGSVRETKIHDCPIPTRKLCRSYAELCLWLQTYRCALPPPHYFTPTPEEQPVAASPLKEKAVNRIR